MSVDSINAEVLSLWKENALEGTPLVYPPLDAWGMQTNGVLFVGCNPATPPYPLPSVDELLGDAKIAGDLMREEIRDRQGYSYYKPCWEIAQGQPWAHVDWFFQRGTHQAKLVKSVVKTDKPLTLFPLAQKQVRIARKLMELCKPKVVVVINAFASKIAREEFGLHRPGIDDHRPGIDAEGFYQASLGGNSVPVLFSGMLTGQRALDEGSFERLKWHVAYSVKEKVQPCPFCQADVPKRTRYPDYLCQRCSERATDPFGRRVSFCYNPDANLITGWLSDTGEKYYSRECLVDFRKCTVSGDRFGSAYIIPNEK